MIRSNKTALTLTCFCLVGLVGFLATTGCRDPQDPAIRIGVKNFDEQKIVGSIAAQLLKGHGYAVEELINCNDTYECHRAIRNGEIDLMLEYTGTGLVFMGQSIEHDSDSLTRVRTIFREIGLKWLGPLGFDNGYRVLVRTDRAAAENLQSIADLAKTESSLRIGCPSEYLRRPVDGLHSLLRTYGIKHKMTSNPVLVDDPEKRYQALLSGKVDVVVGYATDGSVRDPRLKVLDDSKGFFPRYEAAFMIRMDTLERTPSIKAVLDKLESLITTEQMTALNYEVQVRGVSPQLAAESFLKNKNLPARRKRISHKSPKLNIVVHTKDDLSGPSKSAIHAVRQAFPERTLQISRSLKPAKDLADGKARLAVLGAERFFMDRKGRPVSSRDDRIEAVAVLETRAVHLLRRQKDSRDPSTGRIGTTQKGSGGAVIAEAILQSLGKKPAVFDLKNKLFRLLDQKELDGVLFSAQVGDPEIIRAMKKYDFKIVSLDGWITPQNRAVLTYLRHIRIPAFSYDSQHFPVDTYSSQVVLAAPSRNLGFSRAGGAQAAALPLHGLPLPREKMQKILEATNNPEPPDSVLPSAWILVHEDEGAVTMDSSVASKILNIFVVIFLIWIVRLIAAKEPTASS